VFSVQYSVFSSGATSTVRAFSVPAHLTDAQFSGAFASQPKRRGLGQEVRRWIRALYLLGL
jgi:hypothetical protein